MSIARLKSRFRRAALFNFVVLLQMGCSTALKQQNLFIAQALVSNYLKELILHAWNIIFQYEKNSH